MNRFGLLILILLMSGIANADILMLDLNNSHLEYLAAVRAAEARGEKVQRIPPLTADQEKDFQGARNQIWTSFLTKRNACGGDEADSTDCKSAQQTLDQANSAYDQLQTKIPKLSDKMIERKISELKGQGTKITSVIISGHDGDRDFGGDMAHDVTEKSILAAFAKSPGMADNVRSLFLWGCYTGTVADYRDEWKGLPNLNLITGFDAMGPKGNRPSSAQLLRDTLVKEQRLTEAKSKDELRAVADSLEGIDNMHATLCVDRYWLASKRGRNTSVTTIDKKTADCRPPDDAETELNKQFTCYLNVEPGCENPPGDMEDPSKNVIRRYYELLQANRHCTDVMAKQGVVRPNYAQARRLLFDRTVRNSFSMLYAKQMAKFNSLLNELAVPKSLRLGNLGAMSRKAYLTKLQGLKAYYSAFVNGTKDPQGVVRDSRVIAMGYYLNEIHKVENASCTPLSWIEGKSPDESPCGIRQSLSTIDDRSEAEADQ